MPFLPMYDAQQVCSLLGADEMMYQTIEDLVAVGRGLNCDIQTFDASCFDGIYCTGRQVCQPRGPTGCGQVVWLRF